MLSPKLTNCTECVDPSFLLKKIDCKLAELGNNLYNNITLMLNKPIYPDEIIQLIGYKRILKYKSINPSYCSAYSINKIASKVIPLTVGCKSKCPCGNSIISTTTTSTSFSTTTTTTTLPCLQNLITNGNFTSNLNDWNQTIFNSWIWSEAHEGSAHYTGVDENSMLYQSILTIGTTYNVTFDLWSNSPCAFPVKIFVGTSEYDIPNFVGSTSIEVPLICKDNSLFGIQAYDSCGDPINTIFIDNVTVNCICGNTREETITTNDSYTWNGDVYTESGYYWYYSEGINGCINVDILYLTIINTTTTTTTL